jgi:alanyl-tRNA synthetase
MLWHRLQGEQPQLGSEVEGIIDWDRRFRNMQRHSGQHLLSQAMLRVHPELVTVSVSLKSPTCTIDTAGDVDDEDLLRIETLVNEAVSANYPIHTFLIDDSEINDYSLRRPPKVKGKIRLVKMANWELSACGGTHLKSTAEVGIVKILGSEKIKSNLTRIYFRIGLEALEDYHDKHQVITELNVKLSSQVSNVIERFDTVASQLTEANNQNRALQRDVAQLLAQSLLREAETLGQQRLVQHILPERQQGILKVLAEALVVQPDVVALLAVEAEQPKLLFARGDQVQSDMVQLINEVLPLIDGRGGGRPELAQAGGSRSEALAEALERARQALR